MLELLKKLNKEVEASLEEQILQSDTIRSVFEEKAKTMRTEKVIDMMVSAYYQFAKGLEEDKNQKIIDFHFANFLTLRDELLRRMEGGR